jgi:heme-degrading monooxygenase HmoA
VLALLFEFEPRPGRLPRYLDIAASLRPSLLQTEGFLYIDRFQSLSRPEVYLSHSLWRDEASIARWRSFEPHFYAQREARENILAGYRLRISTVLQVDRDWSSVYDQRPGKPRLGIQIQYEEADKRANPAMAEHDKLEAAKATTAKSLEASGRPSQIEKFQCLNHAGLVLSVRSERLDEQAAKPCVDQQWACKIGPPDYPGPILAWVDRDYSMHERDEAPQFHRSCPVHRQPT